jgi:hypothetical protein
VLGLLPGTRFLNRPQQLWLWPRSGCGCGQSPGSSLSTLDLGARPQLWSPSVEALLPAADLAAACRSTALSCRR